MPSPKHTTGQRLSSLRRHHENLNKRTSFADAIGISRRRLERLEKDEAELKTSEIKKIKEVTDTNIDFLLFGLKKGETPLQNMEKHIDLIMLYADYVKYDLDELREWLKNGKKG